MAAHHPDTLCTLAEGERIVIFGKTYTVCLLNAKKRAAYTQNDTLFLALPAPQDASARVALFWRYAAEEVAREMHAMTSRFAPYFLAKDTPLPQISLRRMKSRWGACYYKQNRVSYNTNLIFLPPACLAYVACHELAHFSHPDHSPAFYACLGRVLPNHKELRKYLHTAPIPRVEAVK